MVFVGVGGFVEADVGGEAEHEGFAIGFDVGGIVGPDDDTAGVGGYGANGRVRGSGGSFCGIVAPSVDREITVGCGGGYGGDGLGGSFTS